MPVIRHYTYNLRDVTLIVEGIEISGFGESDAMSVEPAEDVNVLSVGAGGETVWSKTNNYSGTITITLMQPSFSNMALESILLADRIAGGATFAVLIMDTNNNEIIAAPQCRIQSQPTRAFGKQSGERVWVISAAELDTMRAQNPFDGLGPFGPLLAGI